ncbi:MAG: hypothetical protein FWG63_04810 [Defluviitaleaceae bacterium]|nr:hypothetical protein [Defluviitaleaceae bacterium]
MKKLFGLTMLVFVLVIITACGSNSININISTETEVALIEQDYNQNNEQTTQEYNGLTEEYIISILESRMFPMFLSIYSHPTPRLRMAMATAQTQIIGHRFYSYFEVESIYITDGRAVWTASISSPYYNIILEETPTFYAAVGVILNSGDGGEYSLSLSRILPSIVNPRPTLEPIYDFDANLAIDNMLREGIDIHFWVQGSGPGNQTVSINHSNVDNIEIVYIHQNTTLQYYVDCYIFLEDGIRVQHRLIFDYLPDSDIERSEWWAFSQTELFDSATSGHIGINSAFID